MKPTTEQQTIIETAKTGANLAINAFAGCAKTSTCIMLANELKHNSLYIAFNKSIADEAKEKFPSNVECRTLHSLAYEAIIKPNPKLRKKLGGFIDRKDILAILPELERLSSSQLPKVLANISELITKFCQSDKYEFGEFLTSLEDDALQQYEKLLTKVWLEITNQNTSYQITHDVYLKMFHLQKPSFRWYKTIYLDESQDSNEVTLDIVLNASRQGSQVIIVGDKYQCLLPDTIVAGKQIKDINIGDTAVSYAGNNKVEGKVTNVYKKYIKDTVVKITTETGKELTSTKNHTHFIDFKLQKHGYVVYLMYKKEYGYRIGCTQQFYQRCSAESADKVWILKEFGNNQLEARIFEQVTSFKYGLPTLVYKPRTKNDFPKEYFETVFKSLNTETNAANLLKDLAMSMAEPHYIPQAVASEAITFTLTLSGDVRNINNPYHRYSVIFNEKQAVEFKEKFPSLNVRTTCKYNKSFRLEGCSSNLPLIYGIWQKVKETFPEANLKELASVGNGRSLQFCSAFNVKTGMSVLTEGGKLELITKVEFIPYEGEVFDLDIDKYHNFGANGIITHNSIYAWRGAVNAFDSIPDSFINLSLAESFRFGSNIAKVANVILKNLDSHSSVVGRGNCTTINSRAVLTRTNAGLFSYLVDAARQGKKLKVIGDLGDLFSAMYTANNIKFNGDRSKRFHKFIASYDTWKDLVEAAEHNMEVSKILNLIDNYPQVHDSITLAKKAIFDEKRDDSFEFVICTSHKSKGLEWSQVTLADDHLPRGYDSSDFNFKEWCNTDQNGQLLYVAVTRSKNELILPTELWSLLHA